MKVSPNWDINEYCFHNNPCGVMLLDGSGVISSINPSLAQLLSVPIEQLLGHTRDSMPFDAYKSLFDEGLIQLTEVGHQRWLECRIVGLDNDPGRICFYQDVTELIALQEQNERLRQQVEELTITDGLTGLANQRALNRALSTQVTRSRRYQNPLCLAVVELQTYTVEAQVSNDELILATSHYLRDRLRWVDTIGRWDENLFVILLPETKVEDAVLLIDKMRAEYQESAFKEIVMGKAPELFCGVAQWEKGNDPRILLERALEQLNLDKQNHVAIVTH